MELKDAIRTIPDFPKKGIMFRDVTTLMGNPRAFRQAVDELVQPYAGAKIDKVAGIEARGFILGGAVAHQLSAGFVPLRKKGKLPHSVLTESYELEYGVDAMEMHTDAIAPGDRVLLVDDLIATGGTAMAAIKLLRKAGSKIVGAAFLVCLPELQGDSKLAAQGIETSYLVWFSGH
ncbi:MAG: adenine phosphoribosyltransferase [Rhodobacterales bacterium 12-64-8]|nr:MAG: adenine phosphoribosyltransferase [Rhodobacterales bacterium 12-64-8]OYX50661.1 MAG: adenine phosphoribosyltransferase [Alphaproteobacteria bacterium 32-64-14]